MSEPRMIRALEALEDAVKDWDKGAHNKPVWLGACLRDRAMDVIDAVPASYVDAVEALVATLRAIVEESTPCCAECSAIAALQQYREATGAEP